MPNNDARGIARASVPALVHGCLLGALAVAPLQAQELDVRLGDGRLTVRTKAASLHETLIRIAATGVLEIVNADRITGDVSIAFDSQPVLAALELLLADFNYAITMKPDGARGLRYVLRVHSRHGAVAAPDAGPITVAILDAMRAADFGEGDEQAAEPDEADDTARADETSDLNARESQGDFGADAPEAGLLEALADGNPLVRKRALEELARRRVRRLEARLIEALADDDPRVAYFAVDLLGQQADASSLAALGKALTTSGELTVRLRAFLALAWRADPASLGHVAAATSDANATVREAAAHFLDAMARRGHRP
jgi:hypothetical protein